MTYLQHRGGTTGAAVAVLQAQMDEITAEPGDIVSHDAAVFFDGAYWTNETGATVILPDPITPAALSSLGLIPGQAVAGRWRQHSLQSFSVNLVAGARTMLDLTGLTTTSQNFEPTLLGHDFFAGGVFRPTKFATQFDLRMNFKVVSSLIDNSLKFELDIGVRWIIDDWTRRQFDLFQFFHHRRR